MDKVQYRNQKYVEKVFLYKLVNVFNKRMVKDARIILRKIFLFLFLYFKNKTKA